MKAQAARWCRAIVQPRPATAILAFCLTFALRLQGVSTDFILLRDQMRDWSIAMGPFADLPLVGPPTHVGGYTVGPAFYWILWTIRVTLGPFFENLPHAGGIGQAAMQSAADAVLLAAIWRRTGSPWTAIAATTLIATAPFDLSLSAVIWNPTMGTALAKLAMAAILLDWHRGSLARAAAVVGVTWAAVQAYTGTIFVAVGVFGALLGDPLLRRDRRMAWRNALVLGAGVAALQLPYVAHQVTHRFRDNAMSAVVGSVGNVLSGDRPPEIAKSVAGYMQAINDIQVDPFRVPYAGWLLLACCAIVCLRYFRDLSLLSVTVLPQVFAVAGYSLFLAGLDDYYYLSLMPPAVLSVVLATAAPWLVVSRTTGVVLTVAALSIVPARVRREADKPRMPEYQLLVDASRKIVSRHQPMRAIQTDFMLPPTGDAEYLFVLLGGRIDRSSPWICVIRADGQLVYRQVAGS